MSKFKDLTSQQFGRLKVIELSEKRKSGKRYRYFWKCQCECGNYIIARTDELTSGSNRSCGCLHRETAIKNVSINHKHKMSSSRIYHIWQKMKDRCLNENVQCYSRYGGRGIKICDKWMKFENFLEWSKNNGYSDSLSIDRMDNNKDYCPENCRWVDNKTQCRNRRSNIICDYKSEKITLIELSERVGIPYGTLCARYTRGKRGSDLIASIKPKGNPRTAIIDGKVYTLKQLSEKTGININTIKSRYLSGKRNEELIK